MTGESFALEKVTLQLKWKHQFQFAGYYAAVKNGYYRDADLEVELIERTSNKTPFDSVLEGDADYGVAGSEIISEWLAGKPVSVLAVIYQHSPVILITLAESGLTNPQQLVSKKAMLGIARPSADVEAMLTEEGVPLDKLNLLPLSFNIKDLIKGNVDVMSVYSTHQPFYLNKMGVNYNIIRPATYGFDFYGDVLFTSLQEIERQPERVKKFREASLKGWQYALSHVDEMVEHIYDHYNTEKRNLSKEYLRFEAEAIRKVIMPDMIELGHVNPNRLDKIAQTYVGLGLAETGYSLDGFIYDPDPKFDATRLYWVLITVAIVVIILLLIMAVLLRFNRRLQLEITQREKGEEKLRASEERLKEAEQNANLGHWEMNIETGKSIWSDQFFRICGFEPDSFEPSPEKGFQIIHPDDRKRATEQVQNAIQNNGEYNIEKRIVLPDGSVKTVQSIGNVIHNETDKLSKLVGTFQDITERKTVEEKIKATLKEKETLLHEIHHRVKNNLTVVSSLLKLQANGMDDERLKEALKESQNRIYAMSAVHETLHGSENLSEIDLKNYLSKITNSIFQTYSTDRGKVKLSCNLDDSQISLNQAYPLGLTINELISNSLKYAFPDDRKGEITVTMKNLDKQLELIVKDDGVGIPEELDWKNSKSLGLKLVKTLVENQLDGSIDMENKNGTKFTIKFNIEA